MANASRDGNFIPTLLGVLNSDGETLVRIKADATVHSLNISDGTTGSDLGPTNAARDANNVPSLMAVSSADGETPVVVYADVNGNLLIDSQ